MPKWGLNSAMRMQKPYGLAPGLLEPAKTITDPVEGDIRLSELERRIVDSPPFQRLRRVKQLGATHLVYPGATHTRFSHSLGTVVAAQMLIDIVIEQRDGPSPKSDIFGEWQASEAAGGPSALKKTAEAIVLTRLGALLHDLCHNGDGQDDLAVSTTSGADVIYGQTPTAPIDLSQPFAGYALTAPTEAASTTGGVSNTTVAAGGDMNGDGIDDLLVSFPDPVSGPAQTYIVYSAEAPGNLALGSIGGQQGTEITTPANAAGVGGITNEDIAESNGTPAVLIGASTDSQNSRGGSGSIYQLTADQLTGSVYNPSAAPQSEGSLSPAPAALSNALSGPGTCADNVGTYKKAVAYTDCLLNFAPTNTKHFGTTSVPASRLASNGRTQDGPTVAHTYTQSGAMTAGTITSTLKSNTPAYLLDSAGGHIGELLQCSASTTTAPCSTAFTLIEKVSPAFKPSSVTIELHADGSLYDYNSSHLTQFLAQGPGCINESDPADYPIVLFQLSGASALGQPIAIRAFMHNTDFAHNYIPVTKVTDPQCQHKRPVNKNGYVLSSVLQNDGFSGLFQGRTTAVKCRSVSISVTSPTCGGPYSTYTTTGWNAGVTYIKMESATTGTANGGVVSAIVPDTDNFYKAASIPYPDPDVPCTGIPTVQWLYGRLDITSKFRAYGWIPTVAAKPGPERDGTDCQYYTQNPP